MNSFLVVFDIRIAPTMDLEVKSMLTICMIFYQLFKLVPHKLYSFFVGWGGGGEEGCARWRNGYYTGLQIKQSGFKPWPWSLHCVLWQDTFKCKTSHGAASLSTQVYKWMPANC